jgi:DNA-directed RNA polymerase specialized sigma24 family protein
MLGSYEHGSFTPEFSVDSESGVMSACVKAFVDLDATVELSRVGNALIDAHVLSETGILGDEQAHVYALREIHGFERGETVTILNANPSTVDSHL